MNGDLYQKIDWGGIGYVDITGNWMLSDACTATDSMANYLSFMRTVAGYIREKNPRIVITAHLSLGSAQPATLSKAAGELRGVVDGFQIAYPLNAAHEHTYSTAANLQALFQGLRPR